MSGRPCWSLLPMTQRAAVDLQQHRRARARVGGACRRRAGAGGRRRRRRSGCCGPARRPRRLNENGNSTRRHSSGRGVGFHVAVQRVAPARAELLVERGRERRGRARAPRSTIVPQPEPRHQGDREADPARPRVERAERDEQRRLPRSATTRCSTASSVVSHAEKKLNAISHSGRRGGRSATRVNGAPTIETTRNQAAAAHRTTVAAAERRLRGRNGARVLGIATRAPYHSGFPTASQSPLRRSDAAADGSRRGVPRRWRRPARTCT